VLAGSGHIAGVVNPPAAHKYQYWTNDRPCGSLESFIDGATEHKGSWWPDWVSWIAERSDAKVPAKGARVPGKGKLKAIEDAPGSYVRAR
jgi:polyhydroxyalkanoate synthase